MSDQFSPSGLLLTLTQEVGNMGAVLFDAAITGLINRTADAANGSVLLAVIETSGNHRDVDLPFQGFIDNSTHNDVRLGVDHVVDHLGGCRHVFEGHVASTADVDHTALRPVDTLGLPEAGC